MLVNKFRNKYSVNGSKEAHIDKIIRDEIKKMFDEGSPSEATLNKLDKRLEQLIYKARCEPAPPMLQDLDARSLGAKSQDSRGATGRRSFQATYSNELKKTGMNVLKPQTTI